MVRFQILISKVFIGSMLLTGTAHAYPVDYFKIHPQQPINQVSPQKQTTKEPVQFGNSINKEIADIDIKPVSSERNFVTRAEFLKATIEGLYPDGLPTNCTEQLSPSNYWLYFRDVPTTADYGPHLCVAMVMGMVTGYSDVTFKPHRPINFAEASKILTKAHSIAKDSQDLSKAWFAPYVDAMRARNALPRNVILDEYVSPNAMAMMVNALR